MTFSLFSPNSTLTVAVIWFLMARALENLADVRTSGLSHTVWDLDVPWTKNK